MLRYSVSALALCVLAHCQQQPITANQPLVVVRDGKYGYIDHSGRFVIKPQFYWAANFSNGFAAVYVCGYQASINLAGEIQPPRFNMHDGWALRHTDTGIGYVDSSGQFRIPPKYEDGLPFSEGMAAVKTGGKWGFIDLEDRVLITPQFQNAYYFHEGVAVADLGNRSVLVDRAGKVVADGFDNLLDIGDGRVLVSRGNKWGFIDLSGKLVVPLVYDSASYGFYAGLTCVAKEGKWGCLDRDGSVVVPFQFDEAGPFLENGLAPGRIGKQTGFIDRSGKFRFLLPYRHSPGFIYGDVAPFWTDDGRFGYMGESGEVIWGPDRSIPDHAPVLGWTGEDAVKSCDGVPASVRELVTTFPRMER